MRTVVNSEQVAHLWANQSQPHARNSSGSVSFDGRNLRSYATVIASIVPVERRSATRSDPREVVLVTCHKYSMTTRTKHMPLVWRAARHLRRFSVPQVCSPISAAREHRENLAFLVRRLTDETARLIRKRNEPGEWNYQELVDMRADIVDYARFFRLRAPEDSDAVGTVRSARLARAARLDTPARRRRLETERARREERERLAALAWIESYSEALVRWRRGDITSYALPRSLYSPDTPIALRYRASDDTVETSQGATVPAPHARRLFSIVASVRARGEGWTPNGHTLHVGAFSVSRIDADGTLVAGCHTILWDEIESFARAQGWTETAEATTAAGENLPVGR